MSGLREAKKEDRKARIFKAAMHLFEELGYEGTSMERIAAIANLGVGTLYNYFPSKLVLLFSIIQDGAGNYLSELDKILQEAGDLQTSVQAFLSIYLRSFSTYGRRIWREVFREAFFRDSTVARKIDLIDQPFVSRLHTLLQLNMSRGKLKPEINCDTAASLIYSLLCGHILHYVSNMDMTPEQLSESLRQEAALVVDGLLP